MDDLETKLRAAKLEEPSEQLDANVQRLFATAALRKPPVWRARIMLWQGAAACLVSLGFGYLLHAYLEPAQPKSEPARTVYMIPADSDLRGIFDATQKRPAPAMDARKFEVRVVPAENNSANPAERSL